MNTWTFRECGWTAKIFGKTRPQNREIVCNLVIKTNINIDNYRRVPGKNEILIIMSDFYNRVTGQKLVADIQSLYVYKVTILEFTSAFNKPENEIISPLTSNFMQILSTLKFIEIILIWLRERNLHRTGFTTVDKILFRK